MDAKILGNFEKIGFPQFGVKSIKAKIDTGAFTGALHCTTIKEEKAGKQSILHFSPFDHPDVKISTDDFYIDEVRSSNGKAEDRYFIKTFIKVQGETYPIILSLADRTNMELPVIIGRKFLADNNFLVDVNKRSRVSLPKVKVKRHESSNTI